MIDPLLRLKINKHFTRGSKTCRKSKVITLLEYGDLAKKKMRTLICCKQIGFAFFPPISSIGFMFENFSKNKVIIYNLKKNVV